MVSTEVTSRKQAYQSTRWTDAAITVLHERYLIKDSEGKPIETPEQMLWRVAMGVGATESLYTHRNGEPEEIIRQFYEAMLRGDFLPNSPTLMNAGTGNNLCWSACFVIPFNDSLEEIYDTVKSQALIHRAGGGTGLALSKLRQNGAFIRGTTGVSSGPMAFLRVLNASTEQVKQGGKRRGANMAIMRVSHPDLNEFIDCKMRKGMMMMEDGSVEEVRDITNFNISVAITDDFMEKLTNNEDYDVIEPHTGKVIGRRNSRETWDRITLRAWQTADPGIFFIDTANKTATNPAPDVYTIEATNPCGEIPMAENDVCNLASINLSKFVVTDGEQSFFDWRRFEGVVRLVTRFLDDVVDGNPYPLPAIAQMAKDYRRIGLGPMGFADTLILLGIPYDSPHARAFARKIMETMHDYALIESESLAEVRGAFPMQGQSRYKDDKPRRNSNLTTAAPTGTISILDNCSSGIEPPFSLCYTHKAKLPDGTYRYLNIAFETVERVARDNGFWSPEFAEHLVRYGTVQNYLGYIPPEWKDVLKTAMDIQPRDHVLMQAAWQESNDSGISKTTNMPNDATVEEVGAMYLLAHQTGCIGITVFRDGCLQHQVLNVGTKEDVVAKSEESVSEHRPGFSICPECKEEAFVHESGCDKCLACGYSYCTI